MSEAFRSSNPHATNPTSINRSPLSRNPSSMYPSTAPLESPRILALRPPLDSPHMTGLRPPFQHAMSLDPDTLFHPPPSSTIHSSDSHSDHPEYNEYTFVLGTRKSNLALIQTHMVSADLSTLHPHNTFPVEYMTTLGDRNQYTPLHLLTPYSQAQPAKSLWTDELEARLVNGGFDLLVHSLKDVPTTLKEGCEIGAMLKREDPRDVVVIKAGLEYETLEDLPDGSVVGTGSVRRVAQLKRAFPGLRFEDMRGNLNTRLNKLDSPKSPYAALILAHSGLSRLGSAHRITSTLSSPVLYHAVGQGALGVELRTGDHRTREALRGVGHWQTEWRCGAERGCLRVLEGGCSVPVGVESILLELEDDVNECTEVDGENGKGDKSLTFDSPMLHFSGILPDETPFPTVDTPIIRDKLIDRRARLTLRVCVTSIDGKRQAIHHPEGVIVGSYQQAERWGERCAREIRSMGAGEILEEVADIRRERERADLERAIEKSRKEAGLSPLGNGESNGTDGIHEGLQGLVRTLAGTRISDQPSA